MSNAVFESAIEKIGRIIAEQHNIQVVFEDRLYTDGQKIVLPRLGDMTTELQASIMALLDHQIAHIKFSDFSVLRSGKTPFHNDVLMMGEDARVEALMMEDYPGTLVSFEKLNLELRTRLVKNWNQLDMRTRLIASSRDALLNRPIIKDPSVFPHLQRFYHLFQALHECGTTAEVKAITDQMADVWQHLLAKKPVPFDNPELGQVDITGAPHPLAAEFGDWGVGQEMPEESTPGEAPAPKQEAEAKEPKPPKKQDKQDKKDQKDKKEAKDKDPKDKKDQKEPKEKKDPKDPKEKKDSEDKEDSEEQDSDKDAEEQNDQDQDGQDQDGQEQDSDSQEGESQEGNSQESDEAGEPSDSRSNGEAQEGQLEDADEVEDEAEETKQGQKPTGGQAGTDRQNIGHQGDSESDQTAWAENKSEGTEIPSGEESAPAAAPKPVEAERAEVELKDAAIDVEAMVNGQINSEAKAMTAGTGGPMIPTTTRFDVTNDHTKQHYRLEYAALKGKVQHLIRPVQTALDRALKVKENARWTLERERGRLSSRMLTKLATNPNYRTPFGEFTREETKNMAIEILVDLSGSMGGTKIATARFACIAMAEALKALEIPFEITGFTTAQDGRLPSGNPSTHLRWSERMDYHVFKSFDNDNLSGLVQMKSGQNNPDGEAVLWAAKRLSKVRAPRKIMIVMSDGQPAAGDQPSEVLERHLRQVVQAISSQNIELVGIGIESASVQSFYDDTLVIRNVSELPKACLQTLARILLRGPKRGRLAPSRSLKL